MITFFRNSGYFDGRLGTSLHVGVSAGFVSTNPETQALLADLTVHPCVSVDSSGASKGGLGLALCWYCRRR